MAANYWNSTQRRFWQFTKEELAGIRSKLENENLQIVQQFPLPQSRHLNIYFNQQLGRLAKRLSSKQQVLATAQSYVKRFYCKVEIRRTNPYLVLATALYLASKMEEAPQHIKFVVQEAKNLWPEFIVNDYSRLGECEFFLISEMSSQLIVHQPYNTLTQHVNDFGLSADEKQLAHSTINDSYMTDIPLLHPPHAMAFTAILLSLVLRPQNVSGGGNVPNMAAAATALAQAQGQAALRSGAVTPTGGMGVGGGGQVSSSTPPSTPGAKDPQMYKLQRLAQFLIDSTIDVEGLIDCTQQMISFYECHEQYNDKATREQINRFIKANILDSKT